MPVTLYSQETFSGTHFCDEAVVPKAIARLEGLGKFKKFTDLIGTRTRDLPA
jgi:hypothetical protein